MKRLTQLSRLVLGAMAITAVIAACAGSQEPRADDDGGPEVPAGVCRDACPSPCTSDDDCQLSSGELCCNYGGELGSACVPATQCPRFCNDDTACNVSSGDACVRRTLDTPRVCAAATQALKLCGGDPESYGAGEVCCGIYDEPVCLPSDLCPQSCEASDQCHNGDGEVCCKTLGLLDDTLRGGGLCIDPSRVSCPVACESSTACDTQAGEVCCNGVCASSCPETTCNTSRDCDSQICCTAPVVTSPWGKEPRMPGYLGRTGTSGGQGGGQTTSSASTGVGGNGGAGGSPVGTPTGIGCVTCGEFVTNPYAMPEDLCAHSIPLLDALGVCVCDGACASDCPVSCGFDPMGDDSNCQNCGGLYCGYELSACLNDV